MNPNRPEKLHIDITTAMTKELVTYENVRQEFVFTTVDKLKLCLIEHKGHLRARREWLAPAGLLVALVTTLVASDFHAALGLTADVWQAMYVLAAVGAAALTVVLGIRAARNIKKTGLDKLIDKITDRSTGSGLTDADYEQFLNRAALFRPHRGEAQEPGQDDE